MTYTETVFYLFRRVLALLNSCFHNLFMLAQTPIVPRMLIYLCIISFLFLIFRWVFFGRR